MIKTLGFLCVRVQQSMLVCTRFANAHTRLAPKKTGLDERDEGNSVCLILEFVAGGSERVPPVSPFLQELFALVSNNDVELSKTHKCSM
jgi:hypothetical protein